MSGHNTWKWIAILLIGVVVLHAVSNRSLFGEEGVANPLRADASANAVENEVAEEEARLAERFRRLELLAGRLAELSRSTQPRRAELLRQVVARSREGDLPGQFDSIVAALHADRLAEAVEGQAALEPELKAMLELLLQEDRDRQLESERKRIEKYIADLNKLIRAQRGIKGRTDGGEDEEQLAKEQDRLADSTGKLGEEIEATEGGSKSSESEQDGEPSDGQSLEDDSADGDSPGDGDPSSPKDGTGDSAESPTGEDAGAKQGSADGEAQPSDEKAAPSESSEGKPSDGDSADGGESSEGESSDGQPADGHPSESSEGAGSPGEGAGDEQPEDEQQSSDRPADRATERLRQAQQRMKQAQERLEEAQREKAAERQEEALRELEQAKAELEEILRQLREEEMERMLVLLEARFRKMLQAQNEVYEQTQKLASSQSEAQRHEVEIASSRLSRREELIVRDADRALDLLREDGTSVAFPEAITQAREDMITVADRLRDTKLDEMTIGLEEDIIATLEEILAALHQALKELRQQRGSESESGDPGEQPLVDQLAELRMIRALQARVNRRTELYDGLLGGDRAMEQDLLEALMKLSERQQHIFEATRDLHQGTNR